jgi:hypothetical protein
MTAVTCTNKSCIGAIAAVIGGMVVFGSNTSTLKQTMTDMKAAKTHRIELISRNGSQGGGRWGGRELNEVGSIGSGRALEGAIVYRMGNMGSKR